MLFHIVMATVNPGITIEDVQRIIRPGVVSYYRIAPNVWVVSSYENSASTLYERVKTLAIPNGRLFIGRLDMDDRQGWMDKPFWEWVRQQLVA
jgi:hypothetical protein